MRKTCLRDIMLNSPVFHFDNGVGLGRDGGVVRHHHEGGRVCPAHVEQQFEDRRAGLDVDVETGAAILELLLDMSRAHATTLVVVTHDPAISAKADTIIEMKDGRIQHDVASVSYTH